MAVSALQLLCLLQVSQLYHRLAAVYYRLQYVVQLELLIQNSGLDSNADGEAASHGYLPG